MTDVSHRQCDDSSYPSKAHIGERAVLPIEVCEVAGHYYQGILACAMKNIIFVESERIPAVGAVVMVSLVTPIYNHSAQDWVEGRVTWICPAMDNFGFSRGFAVQIDKSRCGNKAISRAAANAPVESIHLGHRIMGRLGRTWRRPLPRYEVLGVL